MWVGCGHGRVENLHFVCFRISGREIPFSPGLGCVIYSIKGKWGFEVLGCMLEAPEALWDRVGDIAGIA